MLDQILKFVSENLTASSFIVAGIIDFVLRMVKSDKPLSLAYVIADGAKKLGAIFSKIGEYMDKVLPQRLK